MALPIPTTLILDFYDSYTRNLLSLFSQLGQLRHVDSGARTGQQVWDVKDWQQRVVVVNVDDMTWEHFISQVLPTVSCIILGPGPGSPHKKSDFSWPTRLIREYGDRVPILGVCLGHQGMATAFGGVVVKAKAPRHGQITAIQHVRDQLFVDVPEGFAATQFNSLVVSSAGFPEELEVIAWAEDGAGEREVMGLRHRTRPLWGVQFHPESISSSYGSTILSNFLSLSRQHECTSKRNIDPTLPLPQAVLALSTSSPASPRPASSKRRPKPASPEPRWLQQSVVLSGGEDKTPQDVFEGLIRNAASIGEVWLDSARPTGKPQQTHLILPHLSWSYSVRSHNITVHTPSDTSTVPLQPTETFISTLSDAQRLLRSNTNIEDKTSLSIPLGFIGYLTYEMKEVTLPHCENAQRAADTDAEFAFASTALSFDHELKEWRATGLVRVAGVFPDVDEAEGALGSNFGIEMAEWEAWIAKVRDFFASPSLPSPPSPAKKLGLMTPDTSETTYKAAIEQCRNLITAGESYELCLTTQFRSQLPPAIASDPYPLYLSLRASNPAPYSSYFRLPRSNISLLSSSPERFMHIDRSGHAEMKPIKGTVQRSEDPIEDERRKKALGEDVKERAENLMIVDLCRNDLLGFCEVESVLVPKLMVVESFKTVHQLVTSIVGTLKPEVSPFEAIGRAFPPGSMTGAPKLRSVMLLEELERSVPRGVYSGIFGYVAIDGTTDFSVVIRTLVIKGSDMTLGAGGAITHLSEAAKEWEEVLVKKEAVTGRL